MALRLLGELNPRSDFPSAQDWEVREGRAIHVSIRRDKPSQYDSSYWGGGRFFFCGHGSLFSQRQNEWVCRHGFTRGAPLHWVVVSGSRHSLAPASMRVDDGDQIHIQVQGRGRAIGSQRRARLRPRPIHPIFDDPCSRGIPQAGPGD